MSVPESSNRRRVQPGYLGKITTDFDARTPMISLNCIPFSFGEALFTQGYAAHRKIRAPAFPKGACSAEISVLKNATANGRVKI